MTLHEETLLREKFSKNEDFARAAARLVAGEPLAYILGEWYFWRETYLVTPDVLIPRADTEHVLEALIHHLPQGGRFLDLCTGSGCIAVSALCERPDATAAAVDLSPAALDVARQNAARYRVTDRLDFYRLDVTSPREVEALIDRAGSFDIIVSNPPYIDSDVVETLSPAVLAEPRMALDGGADGMDFYRAILSLFGSALKPNGAFLFEIGYDQKEKIKALAAPLSCTVTNDYGGNPRCAWIPLQEK